MDSRDRSITQNIEEERDIDFDEEDAENSVHLDGVTLICFDVVRDKLGCTILNRQKRSLKVLGKDFTLQYSSIKANSYYNEVNTNNQPNYMNELSLIFNSLLLEYEPSVCLISTRIDDTTVKDLITLCNSLNCKLELRPLNEFNNEPDLEILQITTKSGMTILQDFLKETNECVKITKRTLFCCIHNSYKLLKNCQDPDENIRTSKNLLCTKSYNASICDIETFFLEGKMFLNQDTLFTLDIFPKTNVKEEFKHSNGNISSIFQLLDHTSSITSRKLLISWLKSPLSDIHAIRERYDVLRVLLNNNNSNALNDLINGIKKLINMIPLIEQIRVGRSAYNIWRKLKNWLEMAIGVCRILNTLNFEDSSSVFLENIINSTDTSILTQLYGVLEKIIDFDNSRETGEVIIADNVDPKLDQLKQTYNRLEEVLQVTAQQAELEIKSIATNDPQNISETNDVINALYIPQLGYLISLDLSLAETVSNEPSLKEWQEIFKTPRTVYYKNEATSNLDSEYGDIYGEISDIEIEIIHNLSSSILNHTKKLIELSQNLIHLDVFLSLAHVCLEGNYIEPNLVTDECTLSIEEGWHPIYETLIDNFIPNSIELNGGDLNGQNTVISNPNLEPENSLLWSKQRKERIAVITGANASGKSVYLKQVGVIAFLAHIGCFVPCKKATMTVLDKILTRISTQESLVSCDSSFQADSIQMAQCLSLASEKSLLLVDEYGKGTDVVDGPALFGSIILNLSKNEKCPLFLATTHFHELFKKGVLEENLPGIKFYQSEILLLNHEQNQEDVEEENQGITFLYKFINGIADNSYGIYCAKFCGIPKNIIQRSDELNTLQKNNCDILEHCSNLSSEEVESFNKNKEIAKQFIAWNLDLDGILSFAEIQEKLKSILSDQPNNKKSLFDLQDDVL